MKRQSSAFQLPLLTWVMLALLGGMVVFLSLAAQALEGDKVAAALQRGKPTVAEFGSDTCHTCQEMAKVLQQLKQDYGDQLSVAHVGHSILLFVAGAMPATANALIREIARYNR